VRNARHFHFPDFVIDCIDDAVIANADAPIVPATTEFLDPRGRGSVASAFIRGKMRAEMLSGKRKSSFSALDLNATLYSGTQFAASDELRLDLFQRNTFLVAPGLGDQNILDLLPEFGMYAESIWTATLRPSSSVT